jgi:hypothetical protein
MAVTPETQAYLARTKAPVVTITQVKAALRTFLAGVGKYQGELAVQIQMLHDAQMVETDIQMVAALDNERSALMALRRQVSEVEAATRNIAPTCDQRLTMDAMIRSAATLLGYVV